MKKNSIVEIRQTLVDELINYKGEPIKLNLSSEMLENILFDHQVYYDENKNKIVSKDFAYELNNDYLPCDIIRKIDFTGVSFDGFNCSINFKGIKGVTINPQKMYKKDLSGAKFDGVTFELDERGFDGIYLSDTSFKGARVKDGKPITINPQRLIYRNLASCVFDGVIFNGTFDGTYIYGADFTGSIGAYINPQTVIEKNLDRTKLSNVCFFNNFNGVSVEGADFTGSINAFIDPQKLLNKSLVGTNLKDAHIINKNMDGVILKDTNFTGVYGDVEVNPQKICRRELKGCVLSGVNIIGPLDDCVLTETTFNGSNGAYVNDIQTITYDGTTEFAGTVDMTNALNEWEEKEKVERLIKKVVRNQ